MDKELIKRLATQAGVYTDYVYVPPVRSKTPGKIWEDGHVGWHDIFNEKFAELVAAHEREQCAKVCENHAPTTTPTWVSYAAAIRSRGNK
jgi:hypothetical protein